MLDDCMPRGGGGGVVNHHSGHDRMQIKDIFDVIKEMVSFVKKQSRCSRHQLVNTFLCC